jgi:SAM-dependent methyltransferase
MKTDEQMRHHALESYESSDALELEDKLWWVKGKKTIIRWHINKIINKISKVETIVDIGCGSGSNLDVLAEFGKVIGVEPSCVLSERSRSRGVAHEIYEFPVWGLDLVRSIDLFTMFDVLEHIEDDVDFLKKIKQSGSDNHLLLLSVPACPFLFGEHDKLLSHHRRYSRKMLNDCLVSSGYRLLSIRSYMFFMFPGVFAVRLVDKTKAQLGLNRESVALSNVHLLVNSFLSHVIELEHVVPEYLTFLFGLWLFATAEPYRQ